MINYLGLRPHLDTRHRYTLECPDRLHGTADFVRSARGVVAQPTNLSVSVWLSEYSAGDCICMFSSMENVENPRFSSSRGPFWSAGQVPSCMVGDIGVFGCGARKLFCDNEDETDGSIADKGDQVIGYWVKTAPVVVMSSPAWKGIMGQLEGWPESSLPLSFSNGGAAR